MPYNAKSVLVMRFLNDKAGAYLGEMAGVERLRSSPLERSVA
ncbi:hypothetical protein HMPREF1050_2022 [Haemophilus parahaemolyticus HK385]|uniref:Uncharacterized protein n=1 Tax=Haemophilus parahaemolyticus HK385 TaxID=1095744 RepID=A0ABP2P1C9_HAEPH|nr:hypothetical protein HMPREF1050_2022 [Haemophilus parahaemolyticus HK385]